VKRILTVIAFIVLIYCAFTVINQVPGAWGETIIQTSFNSGELSPRLTGRVDIDPYKSGLKTCLNAVTLPHGGVMRRPGFEYIAEISNSDYEARLIPFIFSDTQAYVLEFGNETMRVFADGGQVYTIDANTDLLLHCDGIDGSGVFTDDGNTGHTVGTSGDGVIDTSIYKFPTASGLFDGVGDYLSIPDHADFNFAAAEWTLDFWIRFDAVTEVECIYSQTDGAGDTDAITLIMDHPSGELIFTAVSAAANVVIQHAAWVPVVDTWYHVAVIRGWGSDTDDWAITVDGATITTFTDASTLPNLGGSVYLMGWADTTTTIDFSENGWSVLDSNGAILNSTAKWGDGSLYTDGVNDVWRVEDPSTFDFCTAGNRTIDFWVKMFDHAGSEMFVSHEENANNKWTFYHVHGDGLRLSMYNGAILKIDTGGGAGEITDTDWHHIAIIKVGDDYGIYLDGSQVDNVNDSDTDTFAGYVYMGYHWNGGGSGSEYKGNTDEMRFQDGNPFNATPSAGTDTITVPTTFHTRDSDTQLLIRGDFMYFDGHVDEVRLSKGVARWTAAFSAPTSAWPIGVDGGTLYEISSPYKSGHLAKLKFAQSADTMYITHPDFLPRRLTRAGHSSWTLAAIHWDDDDGAGVADIWPPLQGVNLTTTTLDPSATTGVGIDIVASAALFNQDHVGTYFSQQSGFYKITAVTDSTNAVATVVDDLTAHVATAIWYQGSWGGNEGYPVCVSFHEDRLIFASNSNQPQTLWISQDGDYENFLVNSVVVATDAMQITILANQANPIKWLSSLRKLMFGTTGGEWWITGNTEDKPLDATEAPTVRREGTYGSADMQPVVIDNAILFVQKHGRILRQINYEFADDAYTGKNLSILAEHLTKDYAITEMAWQRSPYQILWGIRSDGTLLGFTFMPEHDVYGWHRHTTGASGEFESVACIPGDYGEDELWVVVKRTIDSATKRYVERLSLFEFGGSVEDAFYVDSGLSWDGTATASFSGLGHLEGESVGVLGDGVVIADETVSSGAVTIDTASAKAHIGLEYNTDIETLRLDYRTLPETIQGREKQIKEVTARFYETLSAKGGPDSSNLDDFDITSFGTQDIVLKPEDTYNPDGYIFIRQGDPGPMTVLAIIIDAEFF